MSTGVSRRSRPTVGSPATGPDSGRLRPSQGPRRCAPGLPSQTRGRTASPTCIPSTSTRFASTSVQSDTAPDRSNPHSATRFRPRRDTPRFPPSGFVRRLPAWRRRVRPCRTDKGRHRTNLNMSSPSPVVFIHGFIGTLDITGYQLPHAAPDLLGYGKHQSVPFGDISLPGQVEYLRSFVDTRFESKPVDVVGHLLAGRSPCCSPMRIPRTSAE